jgi:hypothetical protein
MEMDDFEKWWKASIENSCLLDIFTRTLDIERAKSLAHKAWDAAHEVGWKSAKNIYTSGDTF